MDTYVIRTSNQQFVHSAFSLETGLFPSMILATKNTWPKKYMLYLKLLMFPISTINQCPGVIFLFSLLWWAASCKIVFSRSQVLFCLLFCSFLVNHTVRVCFLVLCSMFWGFLGHRCWSVFDYCVILVQLTEKLFIQHVADFILEAISRFSE